MDWHVKIAMKAEEDMEGIFQYIAISLESPGIAWNQAERIRSKIEKLGFFPERNPVIREEPWKSREEHGLNVDNYAAFYVLDRESATVTVIRILYAKRDFRLIP